MLSSERGLSSASGSLWAEHSTSQPSRRCIQNTHMFSCDFTQPLGTSTRLAGNGKTQRVNYDTFDTHPSNSVCPAHPIRCPTKKTGNFRFILCILLMFYVFYHSYFTFTGIKEKGIRKFIYILYTLAVSPSLGVADSTKETTKTMGISLRSSSNDEGPSQVWMALLEQHGPSSLVFHNLRRFIDAISPTSPTTGLPL